MEKIINTREKLINAIFEFSGDEIERVEDVIVLAKESEEELIDRIINITRFYYIEYNDCSKLLD